MYTYEIWDKRAQYHFYVESTKNPKQFREYFFRIYNPKYFILIGCVDYCAT